MPTLTTPLRVVAALLRAGAGLLDRIAGGETPESPPPAAPPKPEPARAKPAAARRRTPAAARETPRKRTAAKRPDRARSAAPKDLDDVTLARKVETELFRDPSVPKGHIDVNAAGGVVWLRGEVRTPEDVKRLQDQAQAIPEVRRVENLLHLPHTPAPTRTDTPAAQRKPAGRRTKPHSEEIQLRPDRVNAEDPVPGAEPAPTDLAARREGRRPAPLGSHGNGSSG
jgi:BON domain